MFIGDFHLPRCIDVCNTIEQKTLVLNRKQAVILNTAMQQEESEKTMISRKSTWNVYCSEGGTKQENTK
jgi:hypothetical protein